MHRLRLQRRSLYKAAAREKNVAALSERLVHLQIMQRKFIGMRLPSLSLRGLEGAVAISSNRLRFRRGLPVIQIVYCEIATSLRSSQ